MENKYSVGQKMYAVIDSGGGNYYLEQATITRVFFDTPNYIYVLVTLDNGLIEDIQESNLFDNVEDAEQALSNFILVTPIIDPSSIEIIQTEKNSSTFLATAKVLGDSGDTVTFVRLEIADNGNPSSIPTTAVSTLSGTNTAKNEKTYQFTPLSFVGAAIPIGSLYTITATMLDGIGTPIYDPVTAFVPIKAFGQQSNVGQSPRLKVGQCVFVVLDENVQFETKPSASIQNGCIVASTFSNGLYSYRIKLENPDGNYGEGKMIWLNENQYGSNQDITGAHFFISYNEALAFFLVQLSKTIEYKVIWSLNNGGIITTGEVLSNGNSEQDVNLGGFAAGPLVMTFSVQAISKGVLIQDLEFVTVDTWSGASKQTPISIAQDETEVIGEGSMATTSGEELTTTIAVKTALNTTTVNFLYEMD